MVDWLLGGLLVAQAVQEQGSGVAEYLAELFLVVPEAALKVKCDQSLDLGPHRDSGQYRVEVSAQGARVDALADSIEPEHEVRRSLRQRPT